MVRNILKILFGILFFISLSSSFLLAGPASIPTQILDSWKHVINVPSASNDIKESFLTRRVIPNFIKISFYFASAIAVLSCVYASFLMLTSFWDTTKFSQGTKSYSFVIIGVLIMLFSRWLVWIVENVNITNSTYNPWNAWLESSESLWNLPSWKIETEVIPKVIWIVVSITSIIILVLLIYAWVSYVTILDDDKKKGPAKLIFVDLLIWLWFLLTSYYVISWLLKLNL